MALSNNSSSNRALTLALGAVSGVVATISLQYIYKLWRRNDQSDELRRIAPKAKLKLPSNKLLQSDSNPNSNNINANNSIEEGEKKKESWTEVNKLNQVKRLGQRGAYDAETIHPILNEAFLCHVSFIVDNPLGDDADPAKVPVILPMLFGFKGNTVYLHGSSSSRMTKLLGQQQEASMVCIETTLVDGLVLARSIFHHSANYRSVVIYGRPKLIEDENEKMEALRIISEHVCPKRWEEVREPNAAEMKSTAVLAVDIVSASAKIRNGLPGDDQQDIDHDKWGNIWAGILPLTVVASAPIADVYNKPNVNPPPTVVNYARPM